MSNRYLRQVVVPQWGVEGQNKIQDTTVLVVGAGGLGSYSIQTLVRSGFKSVHIVDRSKVSMSNLNRQILYTKEDVGSYKSDLLKDRLNDINPNVDINSYRADIKDIDINTLDPRPDIVLSCLDNMKARLIVANLAFENSIPLVEMSVSAFYGLVLTTLPGDPCIFCSASLQEEPKPIPAISTAVAVTSNTGANEVIKWTLGLESLQRSQILYIDLLENTMESIPISRSDQCPVHSKHKL